MAPRASSGKLKSKEIMARHILRFVLAALLVTSAALPQNVTSTILGNVRDASSASVPSASVTAVNEATGIETKTQTGSDGEYTIVGLPFGQYTLRVEATGFKPSLIKAIGTLPNRATRQDDTELSARMASYELAFKMQMSVPEVADLSKETEATRRLYGLDDKMTEEFGTQCLMARRLVERGVRFVQLYSGGKKTNEVGWDGHNECNLNHEFMARKVDRPIAGLLADLKSRGLLDSTVVLWGGDFGRTPFTDGAGGGGGNRNGRDHNPYGFSVWMAGGGIRGGKVIGATDEIGLKAEKDKVSMHDLHASLLSLLGLDHKRLTFFFQGRDFRLTDVGGKVVTKLLA